jgi:H+/Cl- antiporter ClcA
LTGSEPDGGDEGLSGRALALAVSIGLIAAVAATAYLEVVALGQDLIFTGLPDALGWSAPPLWWYLLALVLGTGLVEAARRMPGATGAGPLTGFHFDTAASYAPSVLLAALGTIVFGFVLGPEAPLIVLGTTVAAILLHRADPRVRRLGMLLGGVAAIGAVLGNPFITAFLVLEFAAMGAVPAAALLPALVALGSGYLLQVGVGGWLGLGTHALAVPGLPSYETVQLVDMAVGALVAIGAGVIAAVVRELGVWLDRWGRGGAVGRPGAGRGWILPVVGCAITALAIVIGSTGLDIAPELILFSGQGSAMSALIAEGSAGVLLAVLLLKGLAFAGALGGGFRGGPIFPATFLGVAVGSLAAVMVTGTSVSSMVAVGIAATAAVMTRLPFTAGILALLLVGGAGAAVAPLAIMGAVGGFVIRQWIDRRDRVVVAH